MTEIIFRLVKALAIFEHVSKSMHRVSRCLSHGVPRILVVLFPLFPTRFFAYVSSSQVCCSEFKFFTLLCHLCKVKPPSESILVDSSLNFTASSSVAPLPIDSVAPRMYGLEVAPNMTLVKTQVIKPEDLLSVLVLLLHSDLKEGRLNISGNTILPHLISHF